MSQLSLIPALEAARVPVFMGRSNGVANAVSGSPMAPANRPTPAQISYLKKLTRIRTDVQLARFVVRKLGVEGKKVLTRQDFAKVIDMEVSEKRWAA
jgi:hypothetical protein